MIQMELPLKIEMMPEDKIGQMKLMYDTLLEKYDRLRKSLHAKNGSHAKEIAQLNERLFLLEKHICLKM